MGLFDKYFENKTGNTQKDHVGETDKMRKYAKTVNFIASNCMYFEDAEYDLLGYKRDFSKLENIKLENIEKYDNHFLKSYEPKVISIMVLGHFMLTDLNLKIKNDSLANLIKETNLFRSVIMISAQTIVEKYEETYNAMARRANSMTANDRIVDVNSYLIKRILRYGDDVHLGLRMLKENSEEKTNIHLEKAFKYFSFESEDYPNKLAGEGWNLNSFCTLLYQGYEELKVGLKNG